MLPTIILIISMLIAPSVAKSYFQTRSIVGSQPPPSGDWLITGLTIVDSETLIINGSIIVENGGVLVIKNSTIYMNLARDGEYWIEVRTGGNLTVINSTIAPYDTSRFFIRVFPGALFRLDGAEIWYVGVAGDPQSQGLWIATDNVLINNSKIYYAYVAIYLDGAKDVLIQNTATWECKYGVKMVNADSINVETNNQIQASEYAILLLSSRNIVINTNTITGNIYLLSTSNSSISRNALKGYIYLASASNNVNITQNDVDKGFIRVAYSNNTRISGNRFITRGGLYFVESYRNTVTNNRIGLRDIYYYEDASDLTITGAVGQVILIKCYNITVSVSITRNTIVGIELWLTNYSKITGSTILNADEGIAIWGSINNEIYDNQINNTVRAIGIYGEGSQGNIIYLNLFYNTSVYDDGYSAPGVNQFDNGTYGNYWSDYTGQDKNNDGIGDTPYQIDSNSYDRYPLMQNPSLYVRATRDFDGDGVANLDEIRAPYSYWVNRTDNVFVVYGTNPYSPDTDGDGLLDGEEKGLETNPLSNDTDGDGLLDGAELGYVSRANRWSSDPHKYDTDGDGLSDGLEVLKYGTNPASIDTDNDNLSDSEEILLGFNPLNNDSDMDGMPDGWEAQYGLDPTDPSDAEKDLDGDGITNIEEYERGTDPTKMNTNSSQVDIRVDMCVEIIGTPVVWVGLGVAMLMLAVPISMQLVEVLVRRKNRKRRKTYRLSSEHIYSYFRRDF